MRYNFYVNFAFFLIIFTFPFTHNSLIVRPKPYNLDLKKDFKNKYLVKKINYDNKLNHYLKKKISLGDTYIINYPIKEIRVTPISTWSLNNLDLNKLSRELPDLIIDSRETKEINNNNYALGKINNNNFAQTCLINSKTYFFKNLQFNIPKYSEVNYWKTILLKSLINNISFYRSRNEICYLITSSEKDDFELTIEIIDKLIKTN